MPRQLMTKREYARYYQVSEGTVDEWVRQGKVTPERTPGGSPRFTIEEDAVFD
jgi:predicted site-specific integrase-resolvase